MRTLSAPELWIVTFLSSLISFGVTSILFLIVVRFAEGGFPVKIEVFIGFMVAVVPISSALSNYVSGWTLSLISSLN